MIRRVMSLTVTKMFEFYFLESNKTGVSKMSLREQVERSVREEGAKRDWDPSIKSSIKQTDEDKIASRLAAEVLRDNAKLKGIHSNHSIKKILEREAKKQLMEFKPPVISTVKAKEL